MKHIACKNIFCILIILLSCFSCVISASAKQVTNIYTDVPNNHIIKVISNEFGNITVGNKNSNKDFQIKVNRFDSVKFTIKPKYGYALLHMYYNDKDVTDDVVNNTYTVKSVVNNGVIKADYKAIDKNLSVNSDTMKTGNKNILLIGFLIFSSIATLLIFIFLKYFKS